jgi:hypothetical protein
LHVSTFFDEIHHEVNSNVARLHGTENVQSVEVPCRMVPYQLSPTVHRVRFIIAVNAVRRLNDVFFWPFVIQYPPARFDDNTSSPWFSRDNTDCRYHCGPLIENNYYRLIRLQRLWKSATFAFVLWTVLK